MYVVIYLIPWRTIKNKKKQQRTFWIQNPHAQFSLQRAVSLHGLLMNTNEYYTSVWKMLDHTHRLCSLCRWCAAGCSPCPRGSAPVRAGTAPASSARSAGASGWTTRSTTCCSPWVQVCADKRAALIDGAPPQMMGVTDADDGMKPALRSARRSRPWETLV